MLSWARVAHAPHKTHVAIPQVTHAPHRANGRAPTNSLAQLFRFRRFVENSRHTKIGDPRSNPGILLAEKNSAPFFFLRLGPRSLRKGQQVRLHGVAARVFWGCVCGVTAFSGAPRALRGAPYISCSILSFALVTEDPELTRAVPASHSHG